MTRHQILTTDSVERHMEAGPETLYGIVSDVTRTSELSPEIIRCMWVRGATGPAVGARFRAINRLHGGTWPNWPTVVAAEPGREFAISRTEPLSARWYGDTGWPRRVPGPASSSPTPSPVR